MWGRTERDVAGYGFHDGVDAWRRGVLPAERTSSDGGEGRSRDAWSGCSSRERLDMVLSAVALLLTEVIFLVVG